MTTTNIEHEFDFEETVILKTDKEKLPRIVVILEVQRGGFILYKLAAGSTSSYHFECEISRTPDGVNAVGFKMNG